MKIFLKRLILVILSVLLSVYAVRWVAETYFFDTFIFQKSTEYGYFVNNPPREAFGKRAEGLLVLQKRLATREQVTDGVLGVASDGPFTVAVIGDSYVWGQGLRNEDRFAYILEKKLNTVIPSKVISLGECGNDVYDYYLHYRDAQEAEPNINLYIFGLVENDLLFNQYSEDDRLKQQLIAECQRSVSLLKNGDGDEVESQKWQESYSELFGNQCVFQKIIPLLPKTNALYLVMEYDKSDWYMHKYIQPFINAGYQVINPDYQLTIHSYEEYRVSEKDPHPSKKTNQAYADVLFKEIQNTDSFKIKKAAYLLSRN